MKGEEKVWEKVGAQRVRGHGGEMSSRWKCREEVGVTDMGGGEILAEATEANEMNETKKEKRGSPGQAGSGVWRGERCVRHSLV